MASGEWTAETIIRVAKERQEAIRTQIQAAEKTLAGLREEEAKLNRIIESLPNPEQDDKALPARGASEAQRQ